MDLLPASPGLRCISEGSWDEPGYKRRLSPREEEALDAEQAEEFANALSDEVAQRDLYFGFSPGGLEPELSRLTGSET